MDILFFASRRVCNKATKSDTPSVCLTCSHLQCNSSPLSSQSPALTSDSALKRSLSASSGRRARPEHDA